MNALHNCYQYFVPRIGIFTLKNARPTNAMNGLKYLPLKNCSYVGDFLLAGGIAAEPITASSIGLVI